MVKKTTPAKNQTDDSPESPIHILKTATCNSLEGTAKLTYLIGIDDTDAIHWQITANTGGGLFSKEWVPFAGIQQAFADWPEDTPITSITLRPLFRGKSVNTPSFLLAALTAEGLLEPLPKRKRVHQACDPGPFLASLDGLRSKAGNKSGKKPAAKTQARAKSKAPAKAKPAPKAKAKPAAKKAPAMKKAAKKTR